jgi:hypothetical protein
MECAPPANLPASAPTPQKPSPGVLRRIWRISNWLSLAALLWVFFLILKPASAPIIPPDPQASTRAQQKFRESQHAASRGESVPLRLDEAELNAFLSANLGLEKNPATASTADTPISGPLPPTVDEVRSTVRDVKITMHDDRVQAYVLFDFHGKDLTLVLEGKLGAQNGYLHFQPTSGKLGSLPIPQSALDSAVTRMLDSPENRDKLRLPPEVADVRIENGELVVVPR